MLNTERRSDQYKKDDNPDLCFVCNQSYESILNHFSHSQHRPIVLHVDISTSGYVPPISKMELQESRMREIHWRGSDRLISSTWGITAALNDIKPEKAPDADNMPQNF